jgi:O-antigen/teichoic acid export membrane protein
LKILQRTVFYLYAFGAISLGTFWVLADHLISLWLGEIPQHAVLATRTLIIWNLITLFNVPFFFLLKAASEEKVLSLAIWLHTSLLLLMIPIAIIIDVSLFGMLVYWTVSSLFTQLYIYYQVHHKLCLLLPSFSSGASIINLVLMIFFMGYCFYLPWLSLPSVTGYLLYIIPAIFVYFLIITILVYKDNINNRKKAEIRLN